MVLRINALTLILRHDEGLLEKTAIIHKQLSRQLLELNLQAAGMRTGRGNTYVKRARDAAVYTRMATK